VALPSGFGIMVAGVGAPYDLNGNETGDLLYNSWPRRPGEQMGQPMPREFNTTGNNYGVNVACHAGQGYKEPDFAAGKSKRISASYQKTGVLSHRAEEGFRDTKGPAMLVEEPMDYHYGTMRTGLREQRHLPMTGSMVLHGLDRGRPPSPSRSIRSMRSGASGRSNRSQISVPRSQGGASRRSQTSSVSRASHASRAPSWFEENKGPPWNFEPLPMYERTNETYGRVNRTNFRGLDHTANQAAGKSESGWLDPNQLVKTLTRPHPGMSLPM